MTHKQGVRFELAPTPEQAVVMGRHCGLSRAVENFCLEIVTKKWAQRNATEPSNSWQQVEAEIDRPRESG